MIRKSLLGLALALGVTAAVAQTVAPVGPNGAAPTTSASSLTSGTLAPARMGAPYFAYYASASTQTVTTSTPTKILYNTLISDSNSWFDGVTNNRFTPQVAGRYQIHVHAQCVGSAVSYCIISIYKNGSNTYQAQLAGNTTSQNADVAAIVTFNGSTDYIEGWVQVICTGTCTVSGAASPIQTWIEGQFISP